MTLAIVGVAAFAAGWVASRFTDRWLTLRYYRRHGAGK